MWYKGLDQIQRAALTENKKHGPQANPNQNNKPHPRRGRSKLEARTQGSKGSEVITALFVDRTTYGLLLKKMREEEDSMSRLTKYKWKMV